MTPLPSSKTWVEVSSSALAANIQNLRTALAPGVEFCAVVKANAYGHGLLEVVRLAIREDVSTFAVDNVDEALAVRSLDRHCTIIILGMTLPSRLADVVACRAVQVVYDPETVKGLADAARAAGTKVQVTLKIETGLHRQGMDKRELEQVLDVLGQCKDYVVATGASSHFASSEDIDHPEYTYRQLERFQGVLAYLQERGVKVEYSHIACSAAALTLPEAQCRTVRFGIVLYGLWPSQEVRRAITLGRQRVEIAPVLSWRTTIAQVKSIAPGDAVGYGSRFIANRPMRIAVLPVGYSDGYDRKLSNRGEVLLRGTRCPILGTICMNMMMVDVSTVPAAHAGDVVTLIGRDGMHAITADDLADKLGTIHYEVVTRINPLLPRLVV